jgi:hypothetical protein
MLTKKEKTLMNQTPATQVEKKPWQTPELIVLLRSQPEEAVLAACLFLGSCAEDPAFAVTSS